MQNNISFPNTISFVKGDTVNSKVLTIEPCFPGYGTTIGNALRRVLLSSLSGGAVVAVKIKGAKHEFDTVQYIQEDVLEIILNLKNLRFKVHSETDEPVKLTVNVSGETVVTGANIKSTSDVEIANPKQFICTLTDKAAELEMELFVQKGMGYSPTEQRHQEKLELGTIAIDAIFTPVLSCSFSVENVRVGELTNYDKVLMNIHTDGTMTPEEAVKEASQILIDHFKLLTGEKELEPVVPTVPIAPKPPVVPIPGVDDKPEINTAVKENVDEIINPPTDNISSDETQTEKEKPKDDIPSTDSTETDKEETDKVSE